MSINDTLTKIWLIHPIPTEDMLGIAYCFAFFTALWLIVLVLPLPFKPEHINMKKMDDLDVRNRIVSLIHGFGCIFFAGYHMFTTPLQCGAANTLFER